MNIAPRPNIAFHIETRNMRRLARPAPTPLSRLIAWLNRPMF